MAVDETHEHEHVHPEHASESLATYFAVFFALMVLLVLTMVFYYVPFDKLPEVDGFSFGWLNVAVAMTISIIKATMVLLVFMHVRHNSKLVWIYSTAAFLWLAIMIGGFLHDYGSRDLDSSDSHTVMNTVNPIVSHG